ncbi:MAG: hypothetical protein CL846_08120 [Crocinitomicaceae bacterium]|nr:hypothetical protein [Crocinitomicaceae bacterium]|tara:strand:- start:16800 stop:17735 length:936 start_codon:yes stop_codon:yes gene_type:complete
MLIKTKKMFRNQLYPLIIALILFSGCDNSETQKENDNLHQNKSETSQEKKHKNISDEKIPAIYFGVPSPMETTIILKNSGAQFEESIMFPLENHQKELGQSKTAIYLGIYSTDLNYCILSSKKEETLEELSAVINLAKEIHLGSVVNESTKDRIELNLNNKDSMQVIIASTFWKMETVMKENDRSNLSSLIVAGGWIEGLYLACELAKINPDNSVIQQIIADQKYTISNLNELLKSYAFDAEINESIVVPLKYLEKIFDQIKKEEYEETNSKNKEFSDDLIIGKYFKLKFTPEIISSIHNSIESIRNDLNN